MTLYIVIGKGVYEGYEGGTINVIDHLWVAGVFSDQIAADGFVKEAQAKLAIWAEEEKRLRIYYEGIPLKDPQKEKALEESSNAAYEASHQEMLALDPRFSGSWDDPIEYQYEYDILEGEPKGWFPTS